jgi:predicted GTPase
MKDYCLEKDYKNAIESGDKISYNYTEFNFCDFFRLLSLAERASNVVKGKDIILLLGSTGCGKSTTIHYLCGSKLRLVNVNGLDHIEAYDITN